MAPVGIGPLQAGNRDLAPACIPGSGTGIHPMAKKNLSLVHRRKYEEGLPVGLRTGFAPPPQDGGRPRTVLPR